MAASRRKRTAPPRPCTSTASSADARSCSVSRSTSRIGACGGGFNDRGECPYDSHSACEGRGIVASESRGPDGFPVPAGDPLAAAHTSLNAYLEAESQREAARTPLDTRAWKKTPKRQAIDLI